MNDLLTKIYNNILVYDDEIININKAVDDEINQLIQTHKNSLTDYEIEELKDLLSSTALTSQQCGFKCGVKFIIKLIYSSLAD